MSLRALTTRALACAFFVLPLALLSSCGDESDGSCSDRGVTLEQGEARVLQAGAGCERCRCLDGGLQCSPTPCPGVGDGDGNGPGDDGSGNGDGPSDGNLPSDGDGPSDGNLPSDGDGPSDGNLPSDGNGDGPSDVGPPPGTDGAIDMPRCPCVRADNASGEQVANAIGLCGETLQSVSRVGDQRAFAVREDYFGILAPGGGCIGIISTGLANATPTSGGFFDDGGVGSGTAFDESNTSPNPNPEGGPPAYDLAQVVVELTPPPNARGFKFNFMFLSAEWPQYLCQQFNDSYLTIVESQAINGNQPTNISFDQQGSLISVNAAFLELPRLWTTNLASTPFGQEAENPLGGGLPGFPIPLPGLDPGSCPSDIFGGANNCTLPEYCNQNEDLNFVGSGTGWLFSQGPVLPGEDTVRITFSIHDEGDAVLDSKVLISDFQWLTFSPPIFSDKL